MADAVPTFGSSCSILRRDSLKAVADGARWIFVLFIVVVVRFNFDVARIRLGRVSLFVPIVMVIQALMGVACGLYLGRWWFESFEEVAALASAINRDGGRSDCRCLLVRWIRPDRWL